jgi:hypothetical protein
MANYMWFVPTNHQEEFKDREKLIQILEDKFPDLEFDFNHDKEIIILCPEWKNPDHQLSFWISIYDNIEDWMNKSEDVEHLDESGYQDLADKLIEFYELKNPDLQNTAMMKHYTDRVVRKHQKRIEDFFRDYFECYIFDEGIHPEFVLPFKEEKTKPKEKSRVKKFLDFFKR